MANGRIIKEYFLFRDVRGDSGDDYCFSTRRCVIETKQKTKEPPKHHMKRIRFNSSVDEVRLYLGR